jgi:hypothetical protein
MVKLHQHSKVYKSVNQSSLLRPLAPPSDIAKVSSVTAAPITAEDINAEYWMGNNDRYRPVFEVVQALVTQPLNAKSGKKHSCLVQQYQM